jgi:hypothetical protein
MQIIQVFFQKNNLLISGIRYSFFLSVFPVNKKKRIKFCIFVSS